MSNFMIYDYDVIFMSYDYVVILRKCRYEKCLSVGLLPYLVNSSKRKAKGRDGNSFIWEAIEMAKLNS